MSLKDGGWRGPAVRGAIALCGAAALLVTVLHAPYVNWRPVAAPLDTDPLVIRRDAKGDGRFLSPRSGNRKHRGVDLAAPLNTPVRAIRSGRIATVGTHRGLGKFIDVEHGGSLTSRYAHLSDTTVRAGQRVRQGEQIGMVGKTGNARHRWITPHLHIEILDRGTPVDPQALGLRIADLGGPDLNHTAVDADADGGE
jgi:murein DD-endopeptidase MepM/ murein hydrolase activator NlpD